jgi:hypothetical protein
MRISSSNEKIPIAAVIASWTSIDFRIPGSTSYQQPFPTADDRPLILEQKDQLASRSFQRRARSAAPTKTSRICLQASPFRLHCKADTKRLEYANRPRFYIKGGLGAISSSRCQTAHAWPDEPGSGVDSLSLLDEQNGPPQARRSVQNFGGNNGNSLAPEILAPKPEQKRMPDSNRRNRRQSACQKPV